MSEWTPVVVKLEKIDRHPAADTLEISTVLGGYTVIFKEGRFKEGDLAAYVPVDSICSDHAEFEWLGDKKRIKAIRLRGVFSLGILAEPPPGMVEGDSVVEFYGLKKHEYEEEVAARVEADSENSPKHFTIPHYDLESLLKYGNQFSDGEKVLITEKLEGENFSVVHDGERLWVRSRNLYKAEDRDSHWWKTVLDMDLKNKLSEFPNMALMGELYCGVKHFPYDGDLVDGKRQRKIRIFDVWNTKSMKYLEWDQVKEICGKVGLETVPVLFEGEWKTDKSLYSLAEGNSIIGNHLREGFVMRSVPNSFNSYLGRKIVKLKGEAYQLFKAKKS